VLLCRVMGVSRSGFYDYLARAGREPARREREDTALLKQITEIFEQSSKRYGSPRIHAELHKRHVVCSSRRVKRLMRQAGIYALPKRKFKRRKTTETLLKTTNLLLPKPDIVTANQVWYSDITFVKTAEGWLYLAAVMDAYSKRIVGYAMDGNMKTDLVIQALRMATKQRQVVKGLIHHSDSGQAREVPFCPRQGQPIHLLRLPTRVGSPGDAPQLHRYRRLLRQRLHRKLLRHTQKRTCLSSRLCQP